MNCSVVSAGAAALSLGIGWTAHAAVTAEFLPPTDQYGVGANIGFDNGGGANTKWGQRFLAMTDGALDSLRVGILYHHTPANPTMQPLHIAFYDITDSTPGFSHALGTPICEWDVPAADITGDTWPYSPTFTYNGPTVPIIAGRSYAFVLGTAMGVNIDFNAPYNLGGTFQPYGAGAALFVSNGTGFEQEWNAGFRVDVIVPGPAGALLAVVVGLAGPGVLRRRR